MSYTLKDFHFNAVKLGQILKQLRIDKNISIAYISKCTDITRDVLDKIFSGGVRDVKFEQIFKICCVLEIPIEVLMLLMLKDEDIDFADQVLLYDNKEDEPIPSTAIDTVPSSVPDTVVAVAEAVAAAEAPAQPVRATAENPDNVAQLHRHITKLMDLLEQAMSKG